MMQANDFKGFYVEKIDLIDMVETEQQAKDIVSKLSAGNVDDCVYKYSSSEGAQRYKLVGDNSGHDYVIPIERADDWEKFMDIDEDDPASWDVPEWAKMIGGGLTFTDPQS